jgi:prolyl oligopeptidase
MTLEYPQTKREDVVEKLHGQEIADPYRWLEDLNSEETRAWIEEQNALTFSYLTAIDRRPALRERVSALWNYQKFGVPVKRGSRLFFTYNDGLQNQPVLQWSDGPDGPPRTLLDPNSLSEDGTVALIAFEPSDDGRLLAYGLSEAGSDWQTWRVRHVDSGQDLTDRLDWVKFSTAAWTPDGLGFYYSRYHEPAEEDLFKSTNYNHKLYYHRLGAEQAEDRLVYERPDSPEWGFAGQVSHDGRYLVIHVWRGTRRRNGLFVQDLTAENGQVVELLGAFDAAYEFLGNEEARFYVLTDLDAPMSRIMAIDLDRPEREHWQVIIPEAEHALETATMAGDALLTTYLHDAHSHLRLFDLSGRPLAEIELPEHGTVTMVHGRQREDVAYFSFTSHTRPATIFSYRVAARDCSLFRQPDLTFDPAQFETRQVFYESLDGTQVPMFLSHKKGLVPDGRTPLLLHGYGGFNLAKTPVFEVLIVAWMELGGIFAQAALRGGSEYGKAWHDAGRLANKQNVFDDFIAAAEWLIHEEYTEPSRLAIYGRSNGGLLVGACITQRPDLFGACLPQVGVLDMLRFDKFTIGWAWVSDYGSPDNAADFANLISYSPYHNVRLGAEYPPTLILTGDHDDRVFPAHSFKFVASLQAAQAGEAPILIRIETSTGHGMGKPTTMQINEVADMLAFLVQTFEM